MSDEPEWFAHKRYGYGAGLPISWQGWALTIAYVGLMILASLYIRRSPVAYFSIVVMLTAALIAIAARTTKGGWRWRWGDSD